ncbi:hypothetical protein N8I77_006079 [Diaporthe amygdali]|uniref:Histone chaperone domain-containing protein n=1 Tax=Phomopsis amygdali TaxID=1214568 RepID=A0AAD9W681_PHOAM|nr:uncharacterized protein J7T55_006444 [Diaporthe amygdali]KAJ0125100.1 hypothetical protein J7T55_006444 [Diaporthe amygdali]KAK2607405.1 hypothetical protein N8I77_006079 [Diaporthe amygdali]
MATENDHVTENTAGATTAAQETPTTDAKGKGKAVATAEDVPADVAMDDDDDDEDDDEDEAAEDAEEDDETGNPEEAISLDNVVGRRTRGKVIDFAKAAEENPADEDEDEDDDDDFEEEDDKMDED